MLAIAAGGTVPGKYPSKAADAVCRAGSDSKGYPGQLKPRQHGDTNTLLHGWISTLILAHRSTLRSDGQPSFQESTCAFCCCPLEIESRECWQVYPSRTSASDYAPTFTRSTHSMTRANKVEPRSPIIDGAKVKPATLGALRAIASSMVISVSSILRRIPKVSLSDAALSIIGPLSSIRITCCSPE
jgi:hypothetical protein